MRIPGPLLGLTFFLASCGAVSPLNPSAVQHPGPAPLLALQTAAPGGLQWSADHATLPSDAAFAWTWFAAPDLPADVTQMRQLSPSTLISQTADLENSAYFEELLSELSVALRDLRFYQDEVPCENCHQFDFVLTGQLLDGTWGGFRARVFWDH